MRSLFALFLVFISTTAMGEELEEVFSALLTDIKNLDTQAIVDRVNPNGVKDADITVPKSVFISEIANSESNLHKSIFDVKNVICDNSRIGFVSPFQLVVESNGNYQVEAESHTSNEGEIWFAIASFENGDCHMQTFPRQFVRVGGRFYINDYFYP